jgi:branched-chain amino acid transport system permease protein
LLFLELIYSGIVNGFIYAVMSLSFALVLSVVKVWHFAHAGVISVAGFMVYLFYNTIGMSIWLSLIITVIIMGGLGFIIDRVAYQPLRQRKSGLLIFFIVSLLITTLLESLLSMIFGTQRRAFSVEQNQSYDLGFINVSSWDITVMISCGIILVSFFAFIKRTKFGHALTAVATNPEMAETVGIKSKNIYTLAVVIASVLAVPIALLMGQKVGVAPNMGFSVLLVAVVATVVGGIGNYLGAVLAGFLIGIVETIGIWQISSEWQHAIVFGILFICLIFRPSGIMRSRGAN